MKSLTILFAQTETPAAQDMNAGLRLFDPAAPVRLSAPPRTLRWRVSVEGFGRDGLGAGPWPVRTMEFATVPDATTDDLRALVARASRDDAAGYHAGD